MVHVMFTDSPTAPITGSGVTLRDCPLTETKKFYNNKYKRWFLAHQ